MEAVSLQMVSATKLPVLNPGQFELWKIRIKQYFLMIDYALWEVIVNRDSHPPKRTIDGVEQTYPLTTAEEKLARKNELKARGTRVSSSSVRSSNTNVLDSPCLLVLITGTSQSRQHGKSESDSYYLSD
ncbi:hypothetical protein Tco_0761397 [Tanacetum coccineum]